MASILSRVTARNCSNIRLPTYPFVRSEATLNQISRSYEPLGNLVLRGDIVKIAPIHYKTSDTQIGIRMTLRVKELARNLNTDFLYIRQSFFSIGFMSRTIMEEQDLSFGQNVTVNCYFHMFKDKLYLDGRGITVEEVD